MDHGRGNKEQNRITRETIGNRQNNTQHRKLTTLIKSMGEWRRETCNLAVPNVCTYNVFVDVVQPTPQKRHIFYKCMYVGIYFRTICYKAWWFWLSATSFQVFIFFFFQFFTSLFMSTIYTYAKSTLTLWLTGSFISVSPEQRFFKIPNTTPTTCKKHLRRRSARFDLVLERRVKNITVSTYEYYQFLKQFQFLIQPGQIFI